MFLKNIVTTLDSVLYERNTNLCSLPQFSVNLNKASCKTKYMTHQVFLMISSWEFFPSSLSCFISVWLAWTPDAKLWFWHLTPASFWELISLLMLWLLFWSCTSSTFYGCLSSVLNQTSPIFYTIFFLVLPSKNTIWERNVKI